MNLIEISVKRPVFAWVLMFSLIVFGAICLNRMGISQLPDVDFPVLNISVNYEGAAPEVVEAELLEPIEEKLLSIEGIKEMRSTARQGNGRVTLEFDLGRNVDVALQEVQSALSQLRLPTEVDPPVIRKENPEEDPILILSVYGGELREMLIWTDTFLLDQLRFIPGVGEVSITGFSQRNLRIWFDPDRLRAHQLTIADVVTALQSQHVESAAGQFSEGKREVRVRWKGEAEDVKTVENINILRRGGQLINDRVYRIKDVATVEDGLSDVRRMSRFEGKPSISVRVLKQRGTNEVDVAHAVREKLEEVKSFFPKDYEYRVNVDFTRSTEATVSLTVEKLWVAGLITILVCFFFLGSFSASLNILFSIPTSIIGSFIILFFSGFTLNIFTLLALTLSISIVVDDAIMLLENIVRHYRMGKSPGRAAVEGSKEVLPAATAATLAVVAVFLPVIFMDGVIGKFFYQFGVTMTAAVLLSLLEAVVITPSRAAAFMSVSPKVGRFEKWLDHTFEGIAAVYGRFLEKILRWKFVVVGVSLALFVLSLYLVQKIKQEFVPSQDQDILLISGQAPPGASLEKTDFLVRDIETILAKNPYVDNFSVSVGGGGGAAQPNQFFVPVRLKPKQERPVGHQQIMNELRQEFRKLKELRVGMRDISARNLTAGRPYPVAVNIRGGDLGKLDAIATEFMEILEKEQLAVDLDKDYQTGIPELLVEPKRNAMALRGVSVESVGQILAAGVGGIRVGRYTADGRRYDIRFKIKDEFVRSAEDMKRIYVRNLSGNLIPLSELVDIVEKPATQAINRINRQRSIAVYGNVAPGQSQARVIERAQEILKEKLPVGYSYGLTGASAGFNEAFKSLSAALWIGILVAYLILAVQFNSFILPIPVLIALPFSVTGALLALWMFGVSLNLFSFIGLIVLMGIAKKNSILLVEFTNQVRERGEKDVFKALVSACPVRLRPIIMTSVATVAAAVPLLTGNGFGSETREPMGLAIIGGTAVSTLLTLVVVPCLYLILARLERRQPGEHVPIN